MTSERATIIYNPASGRPGRRAENAQAMIRLLAERGVDAEARPTDGPEHATALARQAVADGAKIIVSYGGDGTLNEVIQGIAESRTSLAVWPGGTANVVARDLAIPFNMENLAEVIAARKTRRIALGLAKSTDAEGQMGGGAGVHTPLLPSSSAPLRHASQRYFIMMAGIGLDASIARSVNKKLKRRTGEFAYWVSGINHLFRWNGEPFTVEVDGQRYESTFTLIGNGKGYGGGMMITPGAKLEEPWFEVYIVPPLRNNLVYLRALVGCMRGKPEVAGATLIKGSHITADSAHEPWVEADGEIIGALPMTFDVVPDALSVIVA